MKQGLVKIAKWLMVVLFMSYPKIRNYHPIHD